MEYKLTVKNKVVKNIKKLPESIKNRFVALSKDLSEKGPIQADWPNYSKLSKTEHHCHLSRSWVACWKHEQKTIIIEVYYVGSREKAPY